MTFLKMKIEMLELGEGYIPKLTSTYVCTKELNIFRKKCC